MLLALWPDLIAMPETANYALRDQQKRDERRLAAKKKKIADELAARRLNVSTNDAIVYAGLDTGTDASGNIDAISGNGNDILRYDVTEGARRDGMSATSLAIDGENRLIQDGIDEAMRRRNDEAFFLILASL